MTLLAADDLLAVEPDLAIGRCLRQEMLGDRPREIEGRLVGAGLMRVGRGQHIAVDVAARGQGVEQRRIDGLHRRLQVRLDHAVKLEGLPGRQAQRSIGVVPGDPIELEPLRRRADAAGNAQADHEGIGLFELLLRPLGPQIPVILQIHTVEFDQLLVVLGDRAGHDVGETFGERAAKIAARLFDALVARQFLGHR